MKVTNHECYVSLEVAKLLKEAGFDWKCINRYIKDTDVLVPCLGEANWNDTEWGINDYKSAPTLAIAQRWLREVKGLSVEVQHCYILQDKISSLRWGLVITWLDFKETDLFCDTTDITCDTYESALEAGIKKCLTLILEEK